MTAKKRAVHKFKEAYFMQSECGILFMDWDGLAHRWSKVTCKRCLAKRKK